MELHITKIARFTTKKDGSPLVNKNGKPYTSVRIQTQEHGDKWLSGFENAEVKNWAEGATVDVEVTQNGDYFNFSIPKKDSVDNALLEKTFQNTEFILNRLTGLKLILDAMDARTNPQAKRVVPDTAYPQGSNVTAFDEDEFLNSTPPEDVPF